MDDDLAPLSFVERLARLEERMTMQLQVLNEIRRDHKTLTDTVARASGGFRVLLLLGGLTGLLGAARHMFDWVGSLWPHLPGDGS
jgi:hypothetical protein